LVFVFKFQIHHKVRAIVHCRSLRVKVQVPAGSDYRADFMEFYSGTLDLMGSRVSKFLI